MIKEYTSISDIDKGLLPYVSVIEARSRRAIEKEKELCETNLIDFANGHLYFGVHKHNDKWIIREWAPNATSIYLIGEFNKWQTSCDFKFEELGNGVFELEINDSIVAHGDIFRLDIFWEAGRGQRIPIWVNRLYQNDETKEFYAQFWHEENEYKWKNSKINNSETPLIYEAHIGMATCEEKVGSYKEFKDNMLPRIHALGYNCIQLMAIQEHPYYGSFGYHVCSLFAISSRFGTPQDLKELIDEAHALGIKVIVDLVHAHVVKNEIEGASCYDGPNFPFFHNDSRRIHPAWDSVCYNYGRNELIHYLLSNIKYLSDEFKFDGFRFDGVSSMIYDNHGLNTDFNSYEMYFNGTQDEDAITYIILANKLIHDLNYNGMSIGEDMSAYPGLTLASDQGGLGFDYRLAMGIPDFWIKYLKEYSDDNWNMGEIFYELTNKRIEEKTIGYVESHDQAMVGDKSLFFRLVDKELYWMMNKTSSSLIIDRGIALHKLIRLITFACVGNGYLNFMGNEFGHPEWIDFPREGNDWSYKHARRQWNLVDDKDLRFEYLNNFDVAILGLQNKYSFLDEASVNKIHEDQDNQVLAIRRSNLIFIFNFSPSNTYVDYKINIESGRYQRVLDSDKSNFGGFDILNSPEFYFAEQNPNRDFSYYLNLYLPARTALVLRKVEAKAMF